MLNTSPAQARASQPPLGLIFFAACWVHRRAEMLRNGEIYSQRQESLRMGGVLVSLPLLLLPARSADRKKSLLPLGSAAQEDPRGSILRRRCFAGDRIIA
jgi:hypothetical protein